MITLSIGEYDIVTESGVTISTPDASFAPLVGSYTKKVFSYNVVSSVTSDVYLQIVTQAFSVSESTISTQTPNLPCSFSGSTPIVYSLSSYGGEVIPLFVSIDSTTGVLSIEAPSVSNSVDYSFYIVSTVSGLSSLVNNVIKLTVKKCTASNCQTCSVSNSSVCAICNSGYRLKSGSCSLPESDTAKSLSMANQVIVGSIVLLTFGFSFTNLSSMASLWSAINHMQILFLLFLTGAFIPKDIEGIITGLSMCLNPFNFFQSKLIGDYNFLANFFDFGLENINLEKLGIKSDSTIVNITSFIISIIFICIIHLCIALTQKKLPKENKSIFCTYFLSGIHWILRKLMVLFTFALYIRVILEINQYILVACVSEIYHLNYIGAKRIISISIAFLTFIACVTLIFITTFLALSKDANKYPESQVKRSKFAHLFNGMSMNKKSRLFSSLLQIRRAVFVILLITVEPKSSIIVISILVGLQLIYICLLIAVRPFELIKCNIIEIVNEVYFLIMNSFLLKYNTVADWEETPTTVYTWLISSNSFVGLLVNSYIQPIVASRIDNSVNHLIHQNVVNKNKASPSLNIEFDPTGRRHRVDNRVYAKR